MSSSAIPHLVLKAIFFTLNYVDKLRKVACVCALPCPKKPEVPDALELELQAVGSHPTWGTELVSAPLWDEYAFSSAKSSLQHTPPYFYGMVSH